MPPTLDGRRNGRSVDRCYTYVYCEEEKRGEERRGEERRGEERRGEARRGVGRDSRVG